MNKEEIALLIIGGWMLAEFIVAVTYWGEGITKIRTPSFFGGGAIIYGIIAAVVITIAFL